MRSRVWMAVGVVSMVVLSSAGTARGQASCADCCFYSCIAAHLQTIAGMRDMYAGLAGRKGLTEAAYASAVAEARQRLAVQEAREVGGVRACDWHFPDPKDNLAMKEWQKLGWGLETLDDGRIAWKFKVETDMTKCALDERQLAKLREIAPCGGFADATGVHERGHLDQCTARGPGKTVSANRMAQDEVEGHNLAIAKLEELREAARQACRKKDGSCAEQGANAAADRLRDALPIFKATLGKKR